MRKSKPIRRMMLLENHTSAVYAVVNRLYHTLPRIAQQEMTKEDLFQECMLELCHKRKYFDAAKSKPITFVYLVTGRCIERKREFYNRHKRTRTDVEFDARLHGGTISYDTVDEAETVRHFIIVYTQLSTRLKGEVQKWFFFKRRFLQGRAHTRNFSRFRRIAKRNGLTLEQCRCVLLNRNIRIKIERKIFTCTARNGGIHA